MKKIVTRGNASREVEYDMMDISIRFYAYEMTTKDALRRISAQTEEFLEKLETIGVDISGIMAGKNEVSRDRYDERNRVEAVRRMSMRTAYGFGIVDAVMKIIEHSSYDADIDVVPFLSPDWVEEVNNILLKEATADARNKADLIAKSMGQIVSGIKELKTDEDYYVYDDTVLTSKGVIMEKIEPSGNYSKLSNERKTLRRSVYAEWMIEAEM